MRILRILAVIGTSITLVGCFATPRETASKLQNKFVGSNISELVAALGPPASQFALPGGDVAYQFNVSSATNMAAVGGRDWASASMSNVGCKVRIISDAKGIIKSLNTEDANLGGGLLGAVGAYGGMCAKYFGIEQG